MNTVLMACAGHAKYQKGKAFYQGHYLGELG